MSEVGLKYSGLKFILGGLVLAGLGISQAISGWIGSGVFYRIIYPCLCIPMALLLFSIGFLVFMVDDKTSVKSKQTSTETDEATLRTDRKRGEEPTTVAPPDSGVSLFDARFLAVLLLLGVFFVKLVPVYIKHAQEQQKQQPGLDRVKRASLERFANELAKREQALKQLASKMTDAGLTEAEQDLFFRGCLKTDKGSDKTIEGLQILAGDGDWKAFVSWDFEALNQKADEIIRKRQVGHNEPEGSFTEKAGPHVTP